MTQAEVVWIPIEPGKCACPHLRPVNGYAGTFFVLDMAISYE